MNHIKDTLNESFMVFGDNNGTTEHLFEGVNLGTKVHFLKESQSLISNENKYEEVVLVFVKGHGKISIEDKEYNVSTGTTVLIPANDSYKVINTSSEMVVVEVHDIGASVEFKDLL